MILDVFNQNFERFDKISYYSYAAYTIPLLGKGSFEIRRSLDDLSRLIIHEGWYILFEKDVVGIITYLAPSVDQNTGEAELVIKGYLANFLLSFRCLQRVTNIRGTRTAIVRGLVNNHCINPLDLKRRLPITLSQNPAYNPSSDTETIVSQVAGNSLDSVIEDILEPAEMGYYVAPVLTTTALTGFEFRVIKGTNRSVENTSGNSPVVFSSDLKNVLSSNYRYNDSDYKNMAYVAGEGENEDRVVQISGETDASGTDRRELFVDARDLQSTDENGNDLSPEEYTASLIKRGESKLSECIREQSYSASINEFLSQFVYGVDYFIGDYVTVKDIEIGLTITAQITQVTITSMGEKSMQDIVLGNYKLSTLQKLQRKGVV